MVSITEEGADAHVDRLAQRYLNRETYPASWRFPGEVIDAATETQGHGDEKNELESDPTTKVSKRSLNSAIRNPQSEILRAWLPWIILSVVVFVWGLPQTKALLDGISLPKIPVPGLDKLVMRMPPVVSKPTAEAAVFNFNWLSATGSEMLSVSAWSARKPGSTLRKRMKLRSEKQRPALIRPGTGNAG